MSKKTVAAQKGHTLPVCFLNTTMTQAILSKDMPKRLQYRSLHLTQNPSTPCKTIYIDTDA